MTRALVLGAGASGAAAAALLRREGCDVEVLDGDAPFPGGASFDLAVASPGVALDHPWQAECRARGVKVVSELQLGWTRWRAMGGRALAVTGSKGKSSVVKLVADALGGIPCGNYGRPVCDVVNSFSQISDFRFQISDSGYRVTDSGSIPDSGSISDSGYRVTDSGSISDSGTRVSGAPIPNSQFSILNSQFSILNSQFPILVVEVSSFQMETTDDFRPEAAALLNLQEDHLDRHGTKEAYHALKRRLLSLAGRALDCSGWTAADVPADARALFAGSYFDNDVLAVNGAAAVWLMRAAGLADAAVAAAFAAFEPLPHRMQTVCERGGVRYIDDSKATSLAALAAGTRMAGRPVRLIAGGLGKGDDAFSSIRYLQSTTKKVYLIGRCADQLYDAWHSAVPCEMCGTLEAAVAAASRDARPGEAVLLSPGAASFDQFKNFGARGDRFAALVMKERQKNEC